MQKMRVLVRKPVVLVVFLALLGVSAHAASIVLFTSQDEFQGRLGLPQLAYNFGGRAAPVDGQLVLPGLTITSGDMRVLDGALNFGPYPLVAPGTPAPLSLAMNFGAEVLSFGTQIAPALGAGAINISIDGLTASFDVTAPGFIGFATDFPFRAFNATFVPSRVDSSVGMHFVIDNVLAHAVPEPATLILLATGAGLAGLYRRRRKAMAEGRDERRRTGDADPM